MVLEPRVSAQLLGLLGSVLSGERVLKGTSLFSDRLGEAVAAPLVTLVDDPTVPAAWGAAAFDDEGLACRRNIDDRRRRAALLPLRQHLGPPGGHRFDGQRRARRFQERAGRGDPGRAAAARAS